MHHTPSSLREPPFLRRRYRIGTTSVFRQCFWQKPGSFNLGCAGLNVTMSTAETKKALDVRFVPKAVILCDYFLPDRFAFFSKHTNVPKLNQIKVFRPKGGLCFWSFGETLHEAPNR